MLGAYRLSAHGGRRRVAGRSGRRPRRPDRRMRIWSLHPEYLDARGLVAVWREALLAQAVLRGATRGYRHHPQLARFRRWRSPRGAIAEYLRHVHAEALARGYRFDRGLIGSAGRARHDSGHARSDRARVDALDGQARTARPRTGVPLGGGGGSRAPSAVPRRPRRRRGVGTGRRGPLTADDAPRSAAGFGIYRQGHRWARAAVLTCVH